MKTTINLEGIKLQLKNPDLDGDGHTGDIETIERKVGSDAVSVERKTETGEAIAQLNKDQVEDSRLSSIDFIGRIHGASLGSMVALDSLIGMGIVPTRCGILNRVFMRKSVSIEGQGRKEIVDIVAGKQEREQKLSGWDKMKNNLGFGGGSK